MKRGILLLLLTVAVATVFAEGTTGGDDRYLYAVKGIVTDENGQPLPGAAVKVTGTTFGAGTNTDGAFILRFEDRKERTLKVSFVGYDPQEVKAVPGSDNAAPIEVRLTPASNPLNEVVITGSLTEKPLKEVPVLTRVISQKEIQALNPMSIETLLQYELPGLQIGFNSMSQLPEITYQGMGGEYILFLIDGERISGEGADHNVDFTRFNVDDIERIEIIKGSQSTIYGSNALGGVINIITKNADRPFTGNINARYAGSNGQKYTLSSGIRKDRLSSYTSLTWRTKDSYTIEDTEGKTTVVTSPDGETVNTGDPQYTTVYGYNIWDLTQKLGYTCNERLSTELKGSFYHNKRDIRTGKNYQDFFIDYTLSGKVKYLPAENQQITLSYLFDSYKKNKDYFKSGKTDTDYHNKTQTPRMDYTGTFGAHTVSAGFEGNLEYLKHYFMKDTSSVSMQTYALYLQEDWKVTERLNVVAGVRADYHRKYHLHVTPKLSLMYTPWDCLTLRAGYSQGFRSPSLKELYQEYDMGGLGWMMLYGNPNLKPETSNQYALSAEFTKGGLNMSVSATHNRFKNRITLQSLNDGTSDSRYENAERARTTGIETIVRYRWAFGLTLTGSYAYTDDYEEVEGLNTSSVRPHTATFSALFTRKFGKIGTNLSLNGQWACPFDRYSVNTEQETVTRISYDARTICSMNAGVTLPRGVSLNVGVDNLLNYRDKAADSSLQVPQKGISLIGTVNINLADMFRL